MKRNTIRLSDLQASISDKKPEVTLEKKKPVRVKAKPPPPAPAPTPQPEKKKKPTVPPPPPPPPPPEPKKTGNKPTAMSLFKVTVEKRAALNSGMPSLVLLGRAMADEGNRNGIASSALGSSLSVLMGMEFQCPDAEIVIAGNKIKRINQPVVKDGILGLVFYVTCSTPGLCVERLNKMMPQKGRKSLRFIE